MNTTARRRSSPAVMATCLLLLGSPPVHAADPVLTINHQWIKGAENRSQTNWCDRPTETGHPPAVTHIDYEGEPDGTHPTTGEVYYVRTTIIVPTCETGPNQIIFRLSLPPDTKLVASTEKPPFCATVFLDAPDKPVFLPPEQCTTNRPTFWPDCDTLHFEQPCYDVEPAGRMYRPVVRGAANIIALPVVSSKPLRKQDGAFYAWVQHPFETFGIDIEAASVPVVVAAGPPGSGSGSSAPVGIGDSSSSGGCAVAVLRSREPTGPAFVPLLVALLAFALRRRRG